MEINGKFWASVEFMLRNNSLFLDKLLDIRYNSSKEDSLVYINRLFQYNLIDIFKSFRYLFGRTIIIENSLSYQMVRKIIPNSVVAIIKRILK